MFHPISEMGDLKYLCQGGHEDSGADQKNQHGDAPDKIVDNTIDICDYLNHTFPPVVPPRRKGIRHRRGYGMGKTPGSKDLIPAEQKAGGT